MQGKPATDLGEGRGEASGGSARRYLVGAQSLTAPALPPGLHVVATPIGNLRDITLRALETLAAADLIACEDTRITRRLTEHYGIATPLTAYHDHNAETARPKLLARLDAGAAIALVSDAGSPLVSDPGYRLVLAVREAGHAVTTAPGASAVLAALTLAALPTDRFTFEGFLPPKSGARRNRIAAIAALPTTLVLFESGPRLGAALTDLAAGLGARQAAVCRELTKLHEEVRRADLAELATHYASESAEIRGEIVIVIAPPDAAAAADEATVDAMLRAALARGSVRDAVAEVSALTGQPRADIYRRALALSREAGDDTAA